ncbi:hypothetical protein FQA39_LY10899 [Lamprigera yunnana]|nr:hypothetical protein FQA39_LY10899 [Lamprigera yunnana]
MPIVTYENPENAIEIVLKFYNRTKESLNQDVESVKEWLQKQSHLPEIPDDSVIRRFIIFHKFHIEVMKAKLDMYYTIKSLLPEFFNQHPCGVDAKTITNVVYMIPLTKPTEDLSRIICFKLKDTNPNNFDVDKFMTYILNIAEIRLREEYSLSDTYVCDLNGITMHHFMKCTPVFLKKVNFLIEKVFTIRLNAIYILNAPSFIDSFISIVSRYLKPKVTKRIKIIPTLEQLHEFVSKDVLPKDFGGSLPPLQEFQDLWFNKFEENDVLFQHLMSLRVNEKLRPGKPIDDDILGIQGNFRQLSFD